MPGLPNLFVEAGWLPPMVCILAVWVMTTLSSSMYAEAMERIPGNAGFAGRVEYSTIVDYYFGPFWYKMSQLGLCGALQSLNIISVIQSAQVMDVAISALFGKSCAINLSPFANTWPNATGQPQTIEGSTEVLSCFDTVDLSGGNAWGCHVVLSLGPFFAQLFPALSYFRPPHLNSIRCSRSASSSPPPWRSRAAPGTSTTT